QFLVVSGRLDRPPPCTLHGPMSATRTPCKKRCADKPLCFQHCGAFYLAINPSSFSASFLRLGCDEGEAGRRSKVRRTQVCRDSQGAIRSAMENKNERKEEEWSWRDQLKPLRGTPSALTSF